MLLSYCRLHCHLLFLPVLGYYFLLCHCHLFQTFSDVIFFSLLVTAVRQLLPLRITFRVHFNLLALIYFTRFSFPKGVSNASCICASIHHIFLQHVSEIVNKSFCAFILDIGVLSYILFEIVIQHFGIHYFRPKFQSTCFGGICLLCVHKIFWNFRHIVLCTLSCYRRRRYLLLKCSYVLRTLLFNMLVSAEICSVECRLIREDF